jgi:hypothetical protein
MTDVPDDVLDAARWAAGFSTVPEAVVEEWSGEPHDVTRYPPPGLREPFSWEPSKTQAEGQAELWDWTLAQMEGSAREWFTGVKRALDDLARALDASGLTRRS